MRFFLFCLGEYIITRTQSISIEEAYIVLVYAKVRQVSYLRHNEPARARASKKKAGKFSDELAYFRRQRKSISYLCMIWALWASRNNPWAIKSLRQCRRSYNVFRPWILHLWSFRKWNDSVDDDVTRGSTFRTWEVHCEVAKSGFGALPFTSLCP